MRFPADSIVVLDRSSAGMAICLKEFAAPAAERGGVSSASVAALLLFRLFGLFSLRHGPTIDIWG
jgi:hypothetical protein